MKKKLSVRLLSVLLCLVMMFVCLQASASALSPDDLQQAIDKLAYYTMANLPDGLTAHLNEGWSRAKLDTADAEQLNLLTTIDPDGTKTLYSYDTPIKYVDDEGYIRFIDSSIKPTLLAESLVDWYAYENTANEVKTYFPLFINSGVLIEDNSFSIRMTPDGNNSMVGRDGDYVQYEDVFGQGVDIRYTAINNGVKEDIVIAQYNGDNTFEYIVETEGLAPIRTAGKTVEFYDYTLNLSYTFGEIVMFDADNKTATDNSYTVEELEDGKYLVTLIVDQEFLAADDTAYPVVVDPTVETVSRAEESQRFKASTYYSNGTTAEDECKIVYNESGSAVTHLQMLNMTAFAHINPKEITDVTLNLSFSGFSTEGMDYIYANAYNFDGEPSMNDPDLTWAEVSPRCTAQTESVAQVGSQSQIHIKDIFREWLTAYTKYYSRENTISPEDGLFLYSLTPMDATLCSPGSDNAPSVTVSYTVGNTLLDSGYYYIQSGYYYDDARYMTATSNGAVLGDRNYDDPNQIWYVQRLDELYGPGHEGRYFIYSVGTIFNDYLVRSGNEDITWRTNGDTTVDIGQDSDSFFYIVDQDNGYRRIVTGNNKAVAVKNYSKANGAKIVHEQVKGLDNQRWDFEPARYGIFAKGSTTIGGVVGENVPFEYSLVPINAKYKISVDPDIAELVSSNNSLAYVKCLAPGSTDITVSFSVRNNVTGEDEPYSCTWRLDVYKLTLSKTNINLEWTDTSRITASSDGMPIEWSSSDDNIVTVDSNGNIEAVGIGVATITAKIVGTNVYKTCTVSTMPTYSESQLDIPYVETDSEEINCYGFAIGVNTNYSPGNISGIYMSDWNQLDKVIAAIKSDFASINRSIRVMSGLDAKLYSFEYRIALRVTKNKNEQRDPAYDYHFMKETNDGKWADKHGIFKSKLYSSGTPESIAWSIERGEDYNGPLDYTYNSDIIYFAIGL